MLEMTYKLASENSSLKNFTIAVYPAVKRGVVDVSLIYCIAQKFDEEKL